MSKNLKKLTALVLAFALVAGAIWFSRQSSLKASDGDGNETAEQLQQTEDVVSEAVQITIPAMPAETPEAEKTEAVEEAPVEETEAVEEAAEVAEETPAEEAAEAAEETPEEEATEAAEETPEEEAAEAAEENAAEEAAEVAEETPAEETAEAAEETPEEEAAEVAEETPVEETPVEETPVEETPEEEAPVLASNEAEPEITVSVEIIDEDLVEFGKTVYLGIKVSGADISDVTSVTWEYSADGENWNEIKDSHGVQYGFILTEENLYNSYRATAHFE